MNNDNPILNITLTDAQLEKLRQAQIKRKPFWEEYPIMYSCRYCDTMSVSEEALTGHKCTPARQPLLERIRELEAEINELRAMIEAMQAGK